MTDASAPLRSPLADRIGDFVFELNLDEADGASTGRLAISVMDTVAAIFAGAAEESSRIVIEYVAEYCPGDHAVILGSQKRVNVVGAAMVNATMAHASEFDDSSIAMYGHASAAVFPAALAATEMVDASGQRFLTALTAGVETEARIGRALGERHFGLGWHTAATLGVIGAAAAASKALALPRHATAAAIRLAASRACGMRESVGTMNKALQVGNASRAGVEAALLAAKGADGPRLVFEGPRGFFSLYVGDGSLATLGEPDFDAAPKSLSRGLVHKLYPCSGDIHAALDAILALRTEDAVRVEDIKRIGCRVNRTAATNPGFSAPGDVTEARFSFQYCLAAAWIRGKLGVAEFRDDALNDHSIRVLMQRVDLGVLPDQGEHDGFCSPAEVEVELMDGTKVARRVAFMRGHPENPMTIDDAAQKLESSGAAGLSAWQLRELVTLISNAHRLPRIRSLTAAAAWSR